MSKWSLTWEEVHPGQVLLPQTGQYILNCNANLLLSVFISWRELLQHIDEVSEDRESESMIEYELLTQLEYKLILVWATVCV